MTQFSQDPIQSRLDPGLQQKVIQNMEEEEKLPLERKIRVGSGDCGANCSVCFMVPVLRVGSGEQQNFTGSSMNNSDPDVLLFWTMLPRTRTRCGPDQNQNRSGSVLVPAVLMILILFSSIRFMFLDWLLVGLCSSCSERF